MPGDYTEDALIEQPTITLFSRLSWETANCFHETFGPGGTLGRETSAEVVLVPRVRAAMQRLSPGAPTEAIDQAIEELTRDRSAMSPAQANREIYLLLKNGIKVRVRDDEGENAVDRLPVIDWVDPYNNDFFLASQFWVSGEVYKRRADLVGFVNGLPLVFIELKAAHKKLENAYQHNLKDYKTTVPQLFWYNAFTILSNGSKSRIGSTTAAWEHFTEWKKINSEGEEGVISLDTIVRGTCDPPRLLDIVENFTLFSEERGGLIKRVAKNHQYLGVNNAVEALQKIKDNKGRLGVFWHTQGSGKSYSVIFFAQKVLRKVPGNFTFLIVTDRLELDEQIYQNCARAGAVTEKQVQAESAEDLKRLLGEDHRYVFTLIQKFRTERGEMYPKICDRSDIIVITDEAHRSQYDIFALNMRNALPNAAFIGFTGTPLMAGEEKTKEVFGDYVSVYDFKQSVDDGATVALYYENRIPELQLTNADLNEDLERLIDEAELDEDQERKLEREFAREYHLITRDERLEKIAEDITSHFIERGYQGKAMVVSIDKATAVRMYDKVQKHWQRYLDGMRTQLGNTALLPARDAPVETRDLASLPAEKIRYVEQTDMAVVISQSQNEVEQFAAKGLDIRPHRKRMVTEDLAEKFKDPGHPLRIVFVCAMWMTGFDAPSCSTIYLDKPMRNHTLMQTIARANRVFEDKVNGLIVDYVGVFRELQKALAVYGSGSGGVVEEGETPVKDKAELIEHLKQAIAEAAAFCGERGVDIEGIQTATGFERVKLLDDAVDALLIDDDVRRRFLSLAFNVDRMYHAILPDSMATSFGGARTVLCVLAEKIRSEAPEADISQVLGAVEALLDESISSEGYIIREKGNPFDADHRVDLSRIDFEALKKHFERSRKHVQAAKLRSAITFKLGQLIRFNKSRMDYLRKFQQLIDEYNSGSQNVEEFFARLVAFAQRLNEEERRGIAQGLTEEELAIFDLLTKPEPSLNRRQEGRVKKVARELLETLKREKLVLDWRKRQQSRAAVRLCIEEVLDDLPRRYTTELYQQKCTLVYQHVYDSYFGQGSSVYARAS